MLITQEFLTFLAIDRRLVVAGAVLILPIALALRSRFSAMLRPAEEQGAVWLRFRAFSRLIMASTLAAWWAMWDLNLLGSTIPAVTKSLTDWFAPSSVRTLMFWIPPLVSLGLFLVLAYTIDALVLRLKWTLFDVLRVAFWRVVNFAVPLLLTATATNDILQDELWGAIWAVVAGAVAIVGMVFLRRAEGFRQHEVKGSETRNRALAIAKRMGVNLQRVYVVPAGRGHLTNAYAGGGSIFLTDNLGKQLDKREMDSIIAHELGHIAGRHTFKKLLATIAIYGAFMLVLFLFRRSLVRIRPVLDILVIFVPLAAFYFLSRQHEYEADQKEVEFTGDPETAIRSLAGVYILSAAPIRYSRFAEIFSTHPSFEKRARAMARVGDMPAARISEILRRERVT